MVDRGLAGAHPTRDSQTRDYLGGIGVDMSGEQSTKTRAALQYFAGLL
jgi:hypothetical protein